MTEMDKAVEYYAKLLEVDEGAIRERMASVAAETPLFPEGERTIEFFRLPVNEDGGTIPMGAQFIGIDAHGGNAIFIRAGQTVDERESMILDTTVQTMMQERTAEREAAQDDEEGGNVVDFLKTIESE